MSGGGLAFCDFGTAIAKSIFVCPHDSTHKRRQTCESVCVPYLKDMSEFVCVHECVRIERVQVDKLQTPTLTEWESKRESGGGGVGLSRKGGGEEEMG